MRNEQGFSAIELLVTLFVAATFLIAGYQMYGMIMTDSGEARRQAIAYNKAKEYIRSYKSTVGATCAVSTPLTDSPINVAGLETEDPLVTVAIQCPYGTSSSLSKVIVTIKYGNPQIQVQDSTYATP